MSFSILLITYNESANLASCLDAIKWCDDIVILDSFSTDNTINIAKRTNIRFYQRKFDNFACQRNHGINNFSYKYEWLFHLDADEIFTEELKEEIDKKITDNRYDSYLVPSRTMFMGKWMRFSGMYPTYQMRLGKIKHLKFKQDGHGQKEDMPFARIGRLNSPYRHYSFNKGMNEWLDKHNRYSSDEALQVVNSKKDKMVSWRELITKDRYKRRTALKKLSYRLPCRSLLRFIYMYYFKLGFLDGREGFLYCRLISYYEFLIEVKIHELKYKDVL